MKVIATKRQPRRVRVIVSILALLAMLALVGSIGTAWYFSNQMIKPEHGSAAFPETVERVTCTPGGTITVSLARSPAAARPGRYGLVWPGGSAMLGRIVAETPNRVDRIVLSGTRPTAGMKASMSWTYGSDPKAAFGLDFYDVTVPTKLGPAPAWYIPAAPWRENVSASDTWAITVHGSSADRKQSLKFVPVLHQSGLSILDITYRNDLGAPRSPDGLMHLGESEWQDLDAAVRTAISRGAHHIVLYGGSMGGAIVLQFLAHSPLADHVSSVLLDSPMLSVPPMMHYLGEVHRIPAPLVCLALYVTNWRLGIDIRQIDALRYPPKVRPPALVLQGMADEVMPLSTARTFAAAGHHIGWPIQYAEFPGAGHGEVWNSDPERCEALISGFLKSTQPGT